MSRAGEDLEICVGAPHVFAVEEKAIFSGLVERAGEVGHNALATNIERAKALVIARIAGSVRGGAALKRPQLSYRKRIGNKAGFEISEQDFPFELGYVFLTPELRGKGLSHRLVAAAMAHAGTTGVFATARIDNISMIATLTKAEFEDAGRPYRGRGNRTIGLFIKRSIAV